MLANRLEPERRPEPEHADQPYFMEIDFNLRRCTAAILNLQGFIDSLENTDTLGEKKTPEMREVLPSFCNVYRQMSGTLFSMAESIENMHTQLRATLF